MTKVVELTFEESLDLLCEVEKGLECPQCGESRMDLLVWDDDGEEETCRTCGNIYRPVI